MLSRDFDLEKLKKQILTIMMCQIKSDEMSVSDWFLFTFLHPTPLCMPKFNMSSLNLYYGLIGLQRLLKIIDYVAYKI